MNSARGITPKIEREWNDPVDVPFNWRSYVDIKWILVSISLFLVCFAIVELYDYTQGVEPEGYIHTMVKGNLPLQLLSDVIVSIIFGTIISPLWKNIIEELWRMK